MVQYLSDGFSSSDAAQNLFDGHPRKAVVKSLICDGMLCDELSELRYVPGRFRWIVVAFIPDLFHSRTHDLDQLFQVRVQVAIKITAKEQSRKKLLVSG